MFFTSPTEWDPSVFDYEFFQDEMKSFETENTYDRFEYPMFDDFGKFKDRVMANMNVLMDLPEYYGFGSPISSASSTRNIHQHQHIHQEANWKAL